ncbi:MAG: 50S ribosomal protein L6 [Candidatus Pacebacteria bacterium]|nr:50S ribosomal protein L6 [Candidatus Paceibacterota bacterium]
MSRTGKKPITIPSGVEVKMDGTLISVKGPKGDLSMEVRPEIKVEITDGVLIVTPFKENKKTKALWGMTRALINNMIEGVVNGYTVKLQIEGVGYRAALEGTDLVFQLGFSHPVKFSPEPGVSFAIEKNIISVTGIDKGLVTQVAAKIRKLREPEPYKGKGIRYEGEIVKRKVGKKAAGAGK